MVCADGVHQHLGRADLRGDPVDDALGRGLIGRIGRLAPDAVRQLLQPFLALVDSDDCEPGAASFSAVARPSSPPAPITIATRPLCRHPRGSDAENRCHGVFSFG